MVSMENLLNLQIELFLLMALGFLLTRKGLLSKEARRGLTDLVIYVVLPANIVTSFLIELDSSILAAGAVIFAVSCVIQLFCHLIAKVLYPGANAKQLAVLKYGTVCSNAGFMGNPLVEGLYGSTGLMLASLYLIPQRTVMWSAGLGYFTASKGKDVVRKVLTHPCIIAVFLGLILMLTQVALPTALVQTLKACGGCTTALSMIVIGGILAEIPFRSVFNRWSVYYSLLRLIVIPLLTLLPLWLFKLPPLVTAVSVVLAGMPAGSTTAILAEKYDGDSALAVQLVFLSTALSLITIPLLCLLMEALIA
ncbi:MAG: AEC family transporter [Candidatus Onthomonas sp.]